MRYAVVDKWRSVFSRQKQKIKIKDASTFIHRMSVLLGEGYSFAESIVMLLPHHVDDIGHVQGVVQEKLRNGEGVMGVMSALGIPNHALVSIAIAEQNGHLQEALIGVAKHMKFAENMQGRLKKLMYYPVAMFLFLFVLFGVFRTYFFPNIERMILSRGGEVGEGSLEISRFFLYAPDYGVFLLVLLVMGVFVFYHVLRRQPVYKQIAIQLNIPIWRGYFRLNMTRTFSKYLGNLLLSGFSLQSSLQVLQQQSLQPSLQYCAEQVTKRVVHGDPLTQVIEHLLFFQKGFAVFIEHGEKSGYLGRELVLYSELLDERFEDKIQRLMVIIQPAFFVVIALCIIAAYLSMLLPIYSMIELV